jgi:hypothetical protein
MLPLWAQRLGQRGLQGLEAVVHLVRKWLAPLLEPTLPRGEGWAIGRQRARLNAIRPRDATARGGATVIQHHGPVLGGAGRSPCVPEAPKAPPLEPREQSTDALPRRRRHCCIQPEPCRLVVGHPGRPDASGTPAPPLPDLAPEAGFIQYPHAWHVALAEQRADAMFEQPPAPRDARDGGVGGRASAWLYAG